MGENRHTTLTLYVVRDSLSWLFLTVTVRMGLITTGGGFIEEKLRHPSVGLNSLISPFEFKCSMIQ